MTQTGDSSLRNLPSVEELLQYIHLPAVPRSLATAAARDAIAQFRKGMRGGVGHELGRQEVLNAIAADAKQRIESAMMPHYRKVVNATGIILHTALGRAVLPKCAIEQVVKGHAGYSLLQMDLKAGERSKRDERIESLLKLLTGAEAATVVNNNAAATSIVLNTLARGREVIVSRGQLVEIGGSFRLPDVMAASGVRLVEVGTTNKTHARDYENAINENTAAIMRVHPSNYKMEGFTAEVSLNELITIAHKHKLPLIDDVGAGALIDYSKFGFEREPLLSDSLKAGSDVVTCSGDKLIGAIQAGLILGTNDIINAVRKNPFARIMRVDKLTLTILEATLALWLDEASAMREVPTLVMLCRPLDEIDAQAHGIADAIRKTSVKGDISVIEGSSQMGSGSLPTQDLPTRLVAVHPSKMSVDDLAARLRAWEPPIIARIHEDRLLIDPRTLLANDAEIVVKALSAILGE